MYIGRGEGGGSDRQTDKNSNSPKQHIWTPQGLKRTNVQEFPENSNVLWVGLKKGDVFDTVFFQMPQI